MSVEGSNDSDEFASAESEAEEESSGPGQNKSESPRGTKYKSEDSSVEQGNEKQTPDHHDGSNTSETMAPEQLTGTEMIQHSVASDSEEKKVELLEVDKLEDSEKSKSTSSTEKPLATEVTNETEATSVAAGEGKNNAKEGGGGGGGGWGNWGGWGTSLWSSVSTVAESAQALGQKVTSVIATVEDSLGVPSPEDLAESVENPEEAEETRRLADSIVEHDVLEDEEEEERQREFNPDEAEYIEEVIEDEPRTTAQVSTDEGPVAAVSSFFSGFAAVVQTTGQGLVSGGLDALETLGKKTMEVLSEGDPGLARKRAMLGMGASPSLSQLLKEAKAEASARAARREGGAEESASSAPLNYSRLFEEYNGVGHLEALELLSKECVAKSRVTASELSEASIERLSEKLDELSGAFIIDEDQTNLEDDSCKLSEVKELLSSTSLPIKPDKLIKVSSSWREKVDEVLYTSKEKKDISGPTEQEEKSSTEGKSTEEDERLEQSSTSHEDEGNSATEGKNPGTDESSPDVEASPGSTHDSRELCSILYENGLRSLAELTSASIELFRKMAEVSLVPQAMSGDALVLSKTFSRLMVVLLNELDALASVHAEAITSLDVDGTNSSVTSLYLESSNSGSYVQDAFQLLQPVLKVLLTQQTQVQQPVPDVINRN